VAPGGLAAFRMTRRGHRGASSKGVEDMALDTILVPYDGSEAADDTLRFAGDVVGRGGRVIALYVTRVPPTLPLDPLPPSFDQQGNEALDHAEDIAGRSGMVIDAWLTHARHRAHAVVDVARDEAVDAIFLPVAVRQRRWPLLLMPRALRTIIRQAPCPVYLGCRPAPIHPPVRGMIESRWIGEPSPVPAGRHGR